MKKYAPLWSVLFATFASLAQKFGTRYILKKRINFVWNDVFTAFIGALIGFISFRYRYGNKDKSSVITR